jgi:hypothetical protein
LGLVDDFLGAVYHFGFGDFAFHVTGAHGSALLGEVHIVFGVDAKQLGRFLFFSAGLFPTRIGVRESSGGGFLPTHHSELGFVPLAMR